MRKAKAEVINELIHMLANNGEEDIDATMFEKLLRQHIKHKGYTVQSFGVNTLAADFDLSVKNTQKLIMEGEIEGLSYDADTDKYIIDEDTVPDYDEDDEKNSVGTRLASFIGAQGKKAGRAAIQGLANRKEAQRSAKPRQKAKPANTKQSSSRAMDISLSTLFNYGFALIIIYKIIVYSSTKVPPSTKFWSLLIAVGVTKGLLIDAKDVSLFAKVLFIGIVWLAASAYI